MKNVKYPTLAQESNIKGKVVVQFLVNEDGSLSNFKIVQSVHQSLDNEVLRVLMLLPEFIPASDEKVILSKRMPQFLLPSKQVICNGVIDTTKQSSSKDFKKK